MRRRIAFDKGFSPFPSVKISVYIVVAVTLGLGLRGVRMT